MTRLIVAGCRDIDEYSHVQGAINDSPFVADEIVSGGADGVDALGEEYADDHDIPVKRFDADWDNGPSAGPKRNGKMASYADALVLVWDGESRGSRSMLEKAMLNRLDIYVNPVGYSSVMKNNLTEEQLMERYPELRDIDDVWIRSETVKGLLDGHPDYIWDVASSLSGRYHPPDESGEHGQWLHVKRMAYAYKEMSRSTVWTSDISERQRELGKAAVFFHDIFKNGLPPQEGKLSSHGQHDTLAAEYVRQFTELPEEVARLCDVHNGGWGNDTSPKTVHEHVFHQADMIASRNYSNLGVFEPTDELRGISDQLIETNS